MGLKFSYMNIWALSNISRVNQSVLESIIEKYELENDIFPDLIKINNENDNSSIPTKQVVKNITYMIHESEFLRYLKHFEINESDTEIFLNLFRIIILIIIYYTNLV
jgi:hypothetical protein